MALARGLHQHRCTSLLSGMPNPKVDLQVPARSFVSPIDIVGVIHTASLLQCCVCSQGDLGMGAGGEKPGLSARMKEQAAAVAAELSGKGPAEGVTEAAPLSGDAEAFAPANDSAVHPKLRQKAAGISRCAT